MKAVFVPAVMLAALASASAFADPIDDYIKAEMERQKVPGLVLAVVKDGQVIRTGAYGKSSLELDVPTKLENVFEIGSITKQFTAILTLMMEEDGKLSLSDPISKYVEQAPDTWSRITLRHLLNQTSGLKEYVVIPGLMLHEEFEMKTFLEKVRPLTLDFEPGVTFAYSNTNYALLGIVLEKASGKSYGDLLKERILDPAKMAETRLINPLEIVPNRASGYWHVQNQLLRTRQSVLAGIADGALLSTVGDMVKYDAALHGGKLLKPQSYAKLIEPLKLNSGRTRNYGMGTFREGIGGQPFIGHHGASPGYSAGYGHFPTSKISVFVMTNVYAINGQAMVTQIAQMIDPTLRVAKPADGSDPDLARTERLRAVLAKMANNELGDDVLEPEMSAPLRTDRARMSPSPFAVLKQIDALTFVSEQKQGSDTLLTYRIKTPQRTYLAFILWTPQSTVANFAMRVEAA